MSDPTLAFELARLMRDASFRDRLKQIGWHSGVLMIPLRSGDSLALAGERAQGQECLLVWRDSTQPHGVQLARLDGLPAEALTPKIWQPCSDEAST